MITQLAVKLNYLDRNVVQASTYLPKVEEVVNPMLEFLSRDYKIKPTIKSSFGEILEPADVSYCISHGAVGQKLNIVSK